MLKKSYDRGAVTFETEAQKTGDEWYEWKVAVRQNDTKRGVRAVEYILHPTFPDRIQTRTSSDDGFALESAGWGEFDIVANVYFDDGDEQTAIVPLKLEQKG